MLGVYFGIPGCILPFHLSQLTTSCWSTAIYSTNQSTQCIKPLKFLLVVADPQEIGHMWLFQARPNQPRDIPLKPIHQSSSNLVVEKVNVPLDNYFHPFHKIHHHLFSCISLLIILPVQHLFSFSIILIYTSINICSLTSLSPMGTLSITTFNSLHDSSLSSSWYCPNLFLPEIWWIFTEVT